LVISSKTGFPGNPVENLLEELGTDYLDILFAHDVAIDDTTPVKEALVSWQEQKALGKVRVLGLSTHDAEVASQAGEWSEADVLMLPINSVGICLPEYPIVGGIERMMQAAEKAWRSGKGIVAMKVMGCGVLAQDPQDAIRFVDDLPYVHSLCIGMRSLAEIEQNVRIIEGEA
jgi:aryl-alcohol dehydrogenase-like predicted oxidoreductase